MHPDQPSIASTRILSDEEVSVAVEALRAWIGRTFPGMPPEALGDLDHTVRLMSLGARLKMAREERGLSLKDLAATLRVPQHRLKAVEEGHEHHLKGEFIERYAAELGQRAWLDDWIAANAALAAELKLGEAGAAPSRSRKGAGAAKVKPAPSILRLRITLRDVEPPVWRVIEVPATATFRALHAAIQAAMGWQDRHLHVFRVPDARGGTLEIGAPDPFGMRQVVDGARVRVNKHLAREGQEIAYVYDFGDDWWHDIRLEAIAPATAGVAYPRCIDGARRCPPEDCGGPPGYEELLRAIGDPRHPGHRAMTEWCGEGFDAERFEVESVVFGRGRQARGR